MSGREDFYAGLFSTVTPLVTNGVLKSASRRLDLLDDVDVLNMPAFYQNQGDETPFQDTLSGAQLVRISLLWYVYVGTDPSMTDPTSTVLNPVVDAVVGLLPSPGNNFVLNINGVTYSLARGKIQYFEGLLGTKAAAKIEVIAVAPFA